MITITNIIFIWNMIEKLRLAHLKRISDTCRCSADNIRSWCSRESRCQPFLSLLRASYTHYRSFSSPNPTPTAAAAAVAVSMVILVTRCAAQSPHPPSRISAGCAFINLYPCNSLPIYWQLDADFPTLPQPLCYVSKTLNLFFFVLKWLKQIWQHCQQFLAHKIAVSIGVASIYD